MAVRLNYESVTKSCVFTDHFNQSNFHFCDKTNVFTYFRLIIFMPIFNFGFKLFPKYNLSIGIV